MDLSKYELGQWIPELGKFKKRCELKKCGNYFAGRKNRKHCNDKCKSQKNSDLAEERRELSKRFTDETLKANIAFQKCLNDKDSINEVTKSKLIKSGYSGDAPTKKIKDDRFHGDWLSVGSFAYRGSSSNPDIIQFIYVQREELWQ
jgi:hypothetical protein